MGNFTVIGVISETIRELLQKELNESFTNDFATNGNEVALVSPKDMQNTHRLSLFLYHIVENPYMKNQSMERFEKNQLKYSPLSLNLYYLLTPNKIEEATIKTWDAHAILGRAMQVLYDNSILEGPDLKSLLEAPDHDYSDFYDIIGQVRIILNSLSLDDLTKIWGALDTDLMLSVSYEVRVIMIESERIKEFTRIKEKNADYYQIKGKEKPGES